MALVSISSTLYAHIFCVNVISAAFFLITCTYVYMEKAAETTFVQKMRVNKIDENDSL